MKRFLIIFALSVLALALSSCKLVDSIKNYADSFREQKLPTQDVTLETKNEKVQLTAEIADSSDERAQGLMYRTKLKDGRGMLFVFDDEAPHTFWMKNMKLPLDILFFNKGKKVVKILENLQPCETEQSEELERCETYSSDVPTMYAMEVPAGFVKEKSVATGDRLTNY